MISDVCLILTILKGNLKLNLKETHYNFIFVGTNIMFNDLCNIVSFLPCKNSLIDSRTTLVCQTHLSYYNVAIT